MSPCSSILENLITNNCPPGPLETGPLQAEVGRLKSKILALQSKLQEYEDLLRKHQAVLSVVRRIPPEVLGIVFSFALPDCSTREDWQELTNLSLVCKDWYQAAKLAHRFTSHLQVEETEVNYESVMSWSRRATVGRILQITTTGWSCPGDHCGWDDEAKSACSFTRPALLLLLAEGPALDHLILKYVRRRCFQHLLRLLAAIDASTSFRPWDKLKTLTLHFLPEGHDDTIIPSMIPGFIDVPPCVTSLNLQLPVPELAKFRAHSPPLFVQPSAFERLTSFSFKWQSYDHDGKILLAALAHCTNLETLAIHFKSNPWSCTDSSTIEIVKLPKLRKLKVTKPYDDSLEFLNFINAPALECLDVHLRYAVKPDSLSSFITEQVARSQNALYVSLRVSRAGGNEEWDIPQFLQHVPHVKHLILDSCISAPKDSKTYKANFFQLLSDYDNTLTHLQVLEARNLPPEIPLYSIYQYIESRRQERADDGLRSLIVKYSPMLLPDSCEVRTAELAADIRAEGLSVDITYPKIVQTDLLDMFK
ncbi:hypothetical protein EST38_g14361 [Candolleomyces aberdarensis]|uniref:Uncharacterized protein n=1 Tax=Candolleomyces aberdarensis TaxID=2316362 RepID=A0A4Q2CZV2_9AGAR|nr:hypothetical protein EST38_g14361 [Candolleomyces aberdarensis]